MVKQRTIEVPVEYEGVGIHTGRTSRVRFVPGEVNTGIIFVRSDMEGAPRIPVTPGAAYYDPAHGRRTILKGGGAEVHTVEHLLAAVHGLGLDNLVIELDGEEPGEPRDGSALPIVDLLRNGGIVEQEAPRRYLALAEPVSFVENGVQLLAVPHDRLRITFTIEYPNPVVGTQSATFDVDEETFAREIAPARTFVLEKDVLALQSAGMIKGGTLNNALVVGEQGLVNSEPLRFGDEFVRHKILDLLGDLYLLGAPIRAHVVAFKSGHESHVKFVKKIIAAVGSSAAATARPTITEDGRQIWDINALMKIMPHRYPMLLVDRILELTDQHVVALKNVTANEQFFEGHFPGHPIMPAVLIIEAMAQAGGFLLLNRVEEPDDKLVYFIGIDNARFRRPVLPGDQLRFELELKKLSRGVCKMHGRALVEGKLVAEADLLASVVER